MNQFRTIDRVVQRSEYDETDTGRELRLRAEAEMTALLKMDDGATIEPDRGKSLRIFPNAVTVQFGHFTAILDGKSVIVVMGRPFGVADRHPEQPSKNPVTKLLRDAISPVFRTPAPTPDRIFNRAEMTARTERVVPDGGTGAAEATQSESEKSTYTRHVEPPEQGGKTYVRCTYCERELLIELGGRDNLSHAPGCPERESQ